MKLIQTLDLHSDILFKTCACVKKITNEHTIFFSQTLLWLMGKKEKKLIDLLEISRKQQIFCEFHPTVNIVIT